MSIWAFSAFNEAKGRKLGATLDRQGYQRHILSSLGPGITRHAPSSTSARLQPLLLPNSPPLAPRRLLEQSSHPPVAAVRARQPSTTSSLAQQRQASSRPSKMWDVLSLSLLQVFSVLSVLSFFTSILAVLHVGGGPIHRFSSNKFDAEVNAPHHVSLSSGKQPLWNWSGLPVSFSLSSLIGEDSREQGSEERAVGGGYIGGAELMRMNWQVGRSRYVQRSLGPQYYDSQRPLSMAKIIMSRHVITTKACSSTTTHTGHATADATITTNGIGRLDDSADALRRPPSLMPFDTTLP
ncbi:uncharacterized protein LAESUDRAFT_760736 [Laetiporus sulphureus 93-53]|uniref:Uncharacterized protein n=1 Tax=Laetiporus sulphureus 93-53 TaxID=1314785 RepID=A0A165DJD4_9APHY|nr:uncharacterized protein LAESUDRAFT_760736 [Laetiporus sulphureus 93-53]KZT05012.1 hypothetical protein LAESUDRAFT_760736 [Laetiporus sulphureus 93-53]